MAVQYITQEVPPELAQIASKVQTGVTLSRHCPRAFALNLSTKRSKASEAGTCGHKLVTEDVVDFLDAKEKFKLASFCTPDNVMD